jgi:hypothetical protein
MNAGLILLVSTLLSLGTSQICPNLGVRFGRAGHSSGLLVPSSEWFRLQQLTMELWVYPMEGNPTSTHVMGSLTNKSGVGFEMV